MRVYITGSCGFVGGFLAQELTAAYPQARLFGMAHAHESRAALPSGMTVGNADLLDRNAVAHELESADPDIVFHLAGFASAAGSDRDRIFAVNVAGTQTLLELLRARNKPCRVHLASSGYVYGATQPGRPAEETDTPQPSGVYAESKAEMERMAQDFASDNVSLTVTRSFNHTGPRQTPDFVLPAFARQIARIEKGLEEPVVRHGNLQTIRDFLHVKDVVRAYRLLLCETEPEPWRVVNVCSGEGVLIADVLQALAKAATVPVQLHPDPARMRPSDMPECVGNNARLCSLTGWSPTIAFADVLNDTLAYWRSQE